MPNTYEIVIDLATNAAILDRIPFLDSLDNVDDVTRSFDRFEVSDAMDRGPDDFLVEDADQYDAVRYALGRKP